MSGLTHARLWHLVDASDKILGRVATRISLALRGKYKPTFDESRKLYFLRKIEDCGDYVVVINAKKVHLTGSKAEQKEYKWHTGWPGGLRSATYAQKLVKNPEYPLQKAVYGMLPRNKHRKRQMSRLYIFPDEFHPYEENILKDYENYDGTTLSDKVLKMIESSASSSVGDVEKNNK